MAYANSADSNHTASEEAVWSGSSLFAIPLSILREKLYKKQNLDRKVWNKVFEILWHLKSLKTFNFVELL